MRRNSFFPLQLRSITVSYFLLQNQKYKKKKTIFLQTKTRTEHYIENTLCIVIDNNQQKKKKISGKDIVIYIFYILYIIIKIYYI